MGYRITKKCSADCPETNTDFGVVAISTKCCKTSLCNFSGANSVKLSYAVMFLGTVASLICVIRAGLWWGLGVWEDVTTQGPTYGLAKQMKQHLLSSVSIKVYAILLFFQHFFSDLTHKMAWQYSSYFFFFPYCFVLIFPEKAILIAHMWQLSDKIKVYVILERVWYIHTKLSLRKQLCRKGLQLESLHHIKFLLFFSVWEYSLGCLSPLTQLLPAAQERHSIKTHVLTDHSELMNEGVNVERSKPFVLLPLQAGTCSGRENCFVTTSTWEGGLGRLHSWQH